MFPKYFVIEQLKERHRFQFNPKCFYIISVQHLLRSTGSMFESIIEYGFIPQNICLAGKVYSTHFETQEKLKDLGINIIESESPKELGCYTESLENDIRKMWHTLSEKLIPNSIIIILDDGGYTLKNAPKQILKNHFVYGIEQTTSGIRIQNTLGKFPVIQVAASAAKVIIEPPIVSEAVKIQLLKIIQGLNPKKVGIVGFGHIGKAIANEFKSFYDILIFDIRNEIKDKLFSGVIFCNSLLDLYSKSDVIIGATGQDISDLNWLKNSVGNKTLISVSSGDIEFNTLLRNCKPYMTENLTNYLQTINLKTERGHSLKILRGGMVANFTGTADSSPGHIIQVTRGLLFSAILQIIRDKSHLETQSGAIILDPFFQKEVVQLWFEDQPQRKADYTKAVLDGFSNINWIKEQSYNELINHFL